MFIFTASKIKYQSISKLFLYHSNYKKETFITAFLKTEPRCTPNFNIKLFSNLAKF